MRHSAARDLSAQMRHSAADGLGVSKAQQHDAIVRRDLPSPQGKFLAMRDGAGESLGKPLADLSISEEIGRIIERAIELSRRPNKDMADAMGYDNAAMLSRWISGAADAQFVKLWAVRWFRPFLVAAMAERAGVGVNVKTTIEIAVSA